jgi:hypothetical protein
MGRSCRDAIHADKTKQGVTYMRKLVLIAALATSITVAVRANATLVSIDYTNDSVHATAVLDVVGGEAISGTGTISGGGLIGTLPMTYIFPGAGPAPLTATPSTDCIPGAVGCYDVSLFSCGCAFVDEDTVFNIGAAIPIDVDGIAFQVGGATLNYGFALYDAGDGTVGEILVGNADPQPDIYIPGVSGGTLSFRTIPEPASLALLSIGVVGMHSVRRRSMSVARRL